jgi:hypothetical protein
MVNVQKCTYINIPSLQIYTSFVRVEVFMAVNMKNADNTVQMIYPYRRDERALLGDLQNR